MIDKGNFDPAKPGTYEVKFTLTDMNGESVSATAKITVEEAPAAEQPDKQEKPGKPGNPNLPSRGDKQQMPPTGAAGIGALGIAVACLLVGIAATAGARMSRKS